MALGNAANPTRFIYSGVGGSVTITDAAYPTGLVVIDYIGFNFVQTTTAAGSTIQIDGRTVAAQRPGTLSQIDGLFVAFPGGFPCWATSGESEAPDASVNVTGACAGATGLTIMVAYHHESPGRRRSLGTEG